MLLVSGGRKTGRAAVEADMNVGGSRRGVHDGDVVNERCIYACFKGFVTHRTSQPIQPIWNANRQSHPIAGRRKIINHEIMNDPKTYQVCAEDVVHKQRRSAMSIERAHPE